MNQLRDYRTKEQHGRIRAQYTVSYGGIRTVPAKWVGVWIDDELRVCM